MHSAKLSAHLQALIAECGSLSFHDYMQTVLYEPGLGYYMVGNHKFGLAGDFTTAPEISPIFAQCLAQRLAPDVERYRNILEFGAGSGRLAFDILTALNELSCLPERYYILEVSAECRERQQALLQQSPFFDRCVWLDNLPDLQAVVIANEVLDAMPVHRFALHDQQILESQVVVEDGSLVERFVTCQHPLLKKTISQHAELKHFQEHYISEINLQLEPWIKTLGESLQQGVVLIVDYGFPQHEYYHADRNMGTLMCHYQQHAHDDFFLYPGLQDITAHVDFTALANAAEKNGFDILEYGNQANFLMDNGLLQFAHSDDAKQQVAINQAIKLLTLPSEMGELFKVMVLEKQ